MGSMALVAPPPPPPVNPNHPVVIPTPPPAPTMAQDLDAIMRMVNMIQIRQLMTRYLLNDAQFQGFVRIINSRDAFLTFLRFRSQPEVVGLINWVQAQILASGGELQLEESEEFMSIINTTPFWANTVFGWQGFVNEFLMYYPQDMIRVHIDMKVAQNGILGHLWQRLAALRPVYERVIAFPEAQRVAAQLNATGIDVLQLDGFIRYQFNWQLPVTVAPPTSTVAPAVSTSTEAIVSSTTAAAAVPVAPVA